jgi:hypothetical protein
VNATMLRKLIIPLLASLWLTLRLTSAFALDGLQMEMELQHLPWKQFRQVVESVPKLKADVEAYGPIGWTYVQQNYKTYGWKKNIDKLNEVQRKQLEDLIQQARKAK